MLAVLPAGTPVIVPASLAGEAAVRCTSLPETETKSGSAHFTLSPAVPLPSISAVGRSVRQVKDPPLKETRFWVPGAYTSLFWNTPAGAQVTSLLDPES